MSTKATKTTKATNVENTTEATKATNADFVVNATKTTNATKKYNMLINTVDRSVSIKVLPQPMYTVVEVTLGQATFKNGYVVCIGQALMVCVVGVN